MQSVQLLSQATLTRRDRMATHPNRAGVPAYHRSLREQVVCILTTGTLSDSFYATGKELAAEALEVMLRARQECPDFLAKALVYARNEGFMRLLPVIGLVVLSGGGGKTRPLFERAFPRVIITPDDLREFVALAKSGMIPGRKGLGGVARIAVRQWLNGLSEYHAVKYGSANSQDMTLRDILRLTHPTPSSPSLAERFGWLVNGKSALGDKPELNSRIRALESLKLAATEDEQLSLIREGGLPYEVVVPSLSRTTRAIWEELLHQAPYFNLLRNLNTFTRHGVFESEENVRYAVGRLTDRRAVERSKVLPFRFFDAWRAYSASDNKDNRIADALRQALEISFCNMPTLGNRLVAIGTDTSGSMNSRVSDKGTARFIDIAGIFTGALLKRCEGRVSPLPFDTKVHHDHGLSGRDDILVSAQKISGYCGGGTAVGAPIQHLLDRKIPVEVFIGITDNEDWAHGGGYFAQGDFLSLWRRYRKEVAPSAKAFLLTIASYRDAVAPSGEPGVHFIYGWSDHVLRFISQKLENGDSQVTQVERMTLDVVNPNGSPTEGNHEDAQIEAS